MLMPVYSILSKCLGRKIKLALNCSERKRNNTEHARDVLMLIQDMSYHSFSYPEMHSAELAQTLHWHNHPRSSHRMPWCAVCNLCVGGNVRYVFVEETLICSRDPEKAI